MFRTVLTIVLVLSMLMFGVLGTAPSQRTLTDTQEMTDFARTIGPVEGLADGKPVSLCHLVEKHMIAGFPIYYVSRGYVLAENDCDARAYYAVLDSTTGQPVDAGSNPYGTPDLSLTQKATPYFIGGVAGFAVLLLLIQHLRQRSDDRARRSNAMATMARPIATEPVRERNQEPLALALIEVVSHVVSFGFLPDAGDRTRIIAVIRPLLGPSFSDERLQNMIANVKPNPPIARIREMARELSQPDLRTLLDAATLAASQTAMSGEKQAFLVDLARLVQPPAMASGFSGIPRTT